MNKVEIVAILLNYGVSETDLLKLPNVSHKHIDKAKELEEHFSEPEPRAHYPYL